VNYFEALEILLKGRTDFLSTIKKIKTYRNALQLEKINKFLSFDDLIPIDKYLANGQNDHNIAFVPKSQKMSFANKLFNAMPRCEYIMVTNNGEVNGKWLGVIKRDDLLYAYSKS
jgi:hypothetical protein